MRSTQFLFNAFIYPRLSLAMLSSYRCVGLPWFHKYLTPTGKYSIYGPKLSRCAPTCHFHNICYNSTADNFIFYREHNLSAIPILIDGNGSEYFAFPTSMFDTSTFNGTIKQFRLMTEYSQVKHYKIVKSMYVYDFKYAGRRRIRRARNNLGHWLFDIHVPLYRLLSLFAGGDEEAGLLTFEDPNARYDGLDTNGWLSTLFRLPTLYKENMSSFTCFKSLVVGDRCLETYDFRNNLKPSFREFPKYVSFVTGISMARPKQPKITLVVKRGKRVPTNYESIVTAVHSSFPNVAFSILNLSTPLSVREQLKLCAKTTLLISPSGGASAIAPFLPTGSTLLIFGFWDSTRNSSYDIDSARFSEFSHFSLKTFPVLLNESLIKNIVMTRSKSQAARGLYYNYNFEVNIIRLLKMITEDLYNWRLETASLINR